MRSLKEIKAEIKKIANIMKHGHTDTYFSFLRGAYVGLLWAAGLNGLMKRGRKFPNPTNIFRKSEFDPHLCKSCVENVKDSIK